ncbi:hypothetical protein [Bosea sp. (in: a-proteobacteria)]|uniref:hypothetical protein n=1 Tax=Bosea sp. (in: a-proteobacteria) TaxID=1871050 RepID=UPI001ACC811C|nr:hypothetical protein [Bosea sp. (in: a-proteobacteria)]MBN9445112.1 hypothetical protein [Bosea sp. (in: a-proteobacteria)]
MAGLCRAPGCGKPATRYGHYCTTHKSRWRRHGDVAQQGVTKEALRPYVALVRARIAKNAGNPTWVACDDRWLAIVDHARGILGEAQRGVPGNRSERLAASAVLKLAPLVEPRAVVETVLAMYLMQDQERRRFRSDAAFQVQLVRRLMRLSEISADEWVDPSTGRVRRTYRDFPPAAVAIIGRWLADALGLAGLHIAKLERADVEKAQQDRADFHKALADLV